MYARDIAYFVPVIGSYFPILPPVPGRPEKPKSTNKNRRFSERSGVPGTVGEKGPEPIIGMRYGISRVLFRRYMEALITML